MESQYTVLKQCRAQLSDRSVVQLRPGDDFPADALIGNPHAWINHGYIRRKDNLPDPASHAASLPPRPIDEEDKARGVSHPVQPGEEIQAPLGGDGNVKPVEASDQVTREQMMELTKADLVELAAGAGVEIKDYWPKAQMIDAILEGD